VKKIALTLPALCALAAVLLVNALPCLAADAAPASGAAGAAPSASQPATTAPALPPVQVPVIVEPNYKLMEEDVLRLDVWGEQQLTGQQMQVTPDGNVNVGYIGDVRAEGLTIAELGKVISNKLAEAGIIYDAKVQLTLINKHRPTVQVLGQVQRPGQVEFKEGDTIIQAVAVAGSYTETAWLENATITHKDSKDPIRINLRKLFDGDLTQNFELKKGDIIYIPPEDYQNKVYVLGRVMRPGIYSLKANTTVMAAISLAGGPLERGALKSTVVVRGDRANPQRVQCNLSKLLDQADVSQDIVLQSGDIVLVPESKSIDWGKISQLLSSMVNLSYLSRSGLF